MADLMFCWGCGKEIHKTAAICPHCGADQKRSGSAKVYTDYSQVPWYRKNWFAISAGILLAPVLFLVALTGNIYYVRGGQLRTYGVVARVFLVLITLVPAVLFVVLIGGVGLVGLGGIAALTDSSDSASSLQDIEKAAASRLRPEGNLSEIFALGSDHTDVQRENKFREIKGQVVAWRLPVYEVSREGERYRVQTQSSMRIGPIGQNLVGTFVYLTPRNDDERQIIEALKTDDIVRFKGRIADVTLRHIEIRPAILTTESVAQPVAAESRSTVETAKGIASTHNAGNASSSVTTITGAYSCKLNSYAFFEDGTYTSTVTTNGERVSLSFGTYSVDGKDLVVTHLGTTNAAEVTSSDVSDPRVWEYEIVEMGPAGFKARVLTFSYQGTKDKMSGNIALDCQRDTSLLSLMRSERSTINATHFSMAAKR